MYTLHTDLSEASGRNLGKYKQRNALHGGEHWTEQYLLTIYSVFKALRIVCMLLYVAVGCVQITYVTLEDGRIITNRW